jgi:hypothetical protein
MYTESFGGEPLGKSSIRRLESNINRDIMAIGYRMGEGVD